MNNVFLQAEWRKLIMVNYAVDQQILLKYLPHGTEIDMWNGTCYVSLVGFLFQNTRLKGFRIPFHSTFEEVNLRFYVRYNDHGEWKRGVVFIREIVPKPALSLVANTLYNENYATMAMRHSWITSVDTLTVEYRWKKTCWNSLSVIAESRLSSIEPESEAEFITEHYWGYTKITASKTSEYGVEHPRWEIYPVRNFDVKVDFEDVYGPGFAILQSTEAKSVFLAEGSPISVKKGRKLQLSSI